jgi:hypothetical protein
MEKVHSIRSYNTFYGALNERKIDFYFMPEKPGSGREPPVGIADRHVYALQMKRRIVKKTVYDNQNLVASDGKPFHEFEVTPVASGSDFVMKKNAKYIHTVTMLYVRKKVLSAAFLYP